MILDAGWTGNRPSELGAWSLSKEILEIEMKQKNFSKNCIFLWVQSKVSKQTKLVHLRKLEKTVTIQKLITTAQTQVTPEFEFMH